MAPTDPPALETKLDSAETVVAPLAWDAAGFTLPPEEVWAAGDARYEARELLGEGGMGAVMLHRDRHVGRNVAMKTIRSDFVDDLSARTRFLREARLQGQLEHPAIVPVYDIGRHADGTAYFTMKRVRGVTLSEVIDKLQRGDAAMKERFSTRRLLAAFGNVCLAVDYAHRHGVVHRDLKPDNVMLGDYGEVYVLDWGVAKVVGAAEAEPSALDPPEDAAATRPGIVVGTVGYMAPEQLHAVEVDPRADIYALGAILFEIFTLTPLHTSESFESFAQEVRRGVEARPSLRAPSRQADSEVDEICLRATAPVPEDRFQTARELHDAVEGYLEGQRDVERRRRLAADHAQAASELSARAEREGADLEERRRALREIGRALALDPDSEQAMEALVTLLGSAPAVTPPEVAEALSRSEAEANRRSSRFGAMVYGGVLLATPITLWLGLRDATAIIPFCLFAVLAAGTSYASSLTRRPDPRLITAVMFFSSAMFAVLGLIASPLLLVPTAVVANTVAFSINTAGTSRRITLALGVGALVVPWLAERWGWLSSSYRFVDEGMLILPRAIELNERLPYFVLAASIVALAASALVVARLRDALARAETRLQLHAWHLGELVPHVAASPEDGTTGG